MDQNISNLQMSECKVKRQMIYLFKFVTLCSSKCFSVLYNVLKSNMELFNCNSELFIFVAVQRKIKCIYYFPSNIM
jgi:hypothetical protein